MKTINVHKLFYIAAMASILACFFLIGLVTYWALYPYKVLEFGPKNGIILTQKVQSGEYVEMQQDYCKYIDIVSQIDRQFIDSIIYQVPQSLNKRPLGCHQRIEYVYIPKAIPPGEYYISTNITFHVNPIRTITKTVKTNMFIVE